MKLKILTSALCLLWFVNTAFSQELNPNIDKDSLVQVYVKELPVESQAEFIKIYEEASDTEKELLILLLTMPYSSKQELVENYNNKSNEIARLIEEYSRLVPDSFVVYVEFNPENRIFQMSKSIDLHIYNKVSKESNQHWNLEYDSDTLAALLRTLGWKFEDLLFVKQLLDEANCVSIENSEPVDVGFARSGMGKYSYLISAEVLTSEEREYYGEWCSYIILNDTVVLEYGGGAIGSDCFPEHELDEKN